MTIPQVLHALGIDADSPQRLTAAQVVELSDQRRRELLDEVIARNSWLPSRLLDLPIAEIARQLSSDGANAPIDPRTLAAYIRQYIHEFENRQETT